MEQVELAHMTWKEVAAARDRKAPVLIPVGTHEQNGSACPLGTDTLVAHEVAKRTAQETGALVAPALSYGCSPIHRKYAGTISLKPDTLRGLIVEVCENLIEDGFDHLVLVNCHQSNEPIIEQVAREIRERLGLLLASFNPITLAETSSKDLYSSKASHGHGAEPIASMLRSFSPESFRPEEACPAGDWSDFEGFAVVVPGRVKVDGAIFNLYLDTRDVSETGGSGDPTASDPERGALIMERVISLASKFVRAFTKLQVRDRG